MGGIRSSTRISWVDLYILFFPLFPTLPPRSCSPKGDNSIESTFLHTLIGLVTDFYLALRAKKKKKAWRKKLKKVYNSENEFLFTPNELKTNTS